MCRGRAESASLCKYGTCTNNHLSVPAEDGRQGICGEAKRQLLSPLPSSSRHAPASLPVRAACPSWSRRSSCGLRGDRGWLRGAERPIETAAHQCTLAAAASNPQRVEVGGEAYTRVGEGIGTVKTMTGPVLMQRPFYRGVDRAAAGSRRRRPVRRPAAHLDRRRSYLGCCATTRS